MNLNRFVLLLSLAVTAVVAGCGKSEPSKPADAPGVAAARSPKQIDNPIPAGDINLAFLVVSGPSYDPATDSIAYVVKVSNNGKSFLASAGARPVHLGVVILGPDGTLKTPPGNREFMRIKLPQPLEPGQSIDIPVTFKVERTLGGRVAMDGVQERVRWFSDYGKPTLELGSFTRCGVDDKAVCTSDGSLVASK